MGFLLDGVFLQYGIPIAPVGYYIARNSSYFMTLNGLESLNIAMFKEDGLFFHNSNWTEF